MTTTSPHKRLKLLSLFFFIPIAVAAQSAPPRKDIPSIAKSANGAVVSIVMLDKKGEPIAQGTGFLVSKDGFVLTNYHVIETGSSAIVKLPDGAFFVVDGVLSSDKARDVAVIKAHGQNFRTLTLGNSDRLQVGEEVVAIGNPLSLESTVSNGIVSGIGRAVKEGDSKFLQVTAPISHGSSGGPLFNMAGEVVGITAGFLEGGENLNFVIPINDAKRLLLTKSAKLKDLPNEQSSGEIEHAEVPKAVVPDKPEELRWLSSERYITPVFSALYPARKPGDPDYISCEKINDSRGNSNSCDQQTEGGGVFAGIGYSDISFEPDASLPSLDKILYREIHSGAFTNPTQVSTSFASINQDQSFAPIAPITARESTAKGMFNGTPARVCIRVGIQERRLWSLVVMVADSTGHTKKELDAFLDSVIVK